MDEIKWSKNDLNNTNLNNILYGNESLANRQRFLQDEIPNECFTKDNAGVSLIDQNKLIVENNKSASDSHGKLNIDGLDRQAQIQQIVESAISDDSRLRIHQILELVSALTSPEKLLLYLRLPTDTQTVSDPLRQPLNPLGSRTEISQTINWIRTHLEEDPQVAMQKQDVYEEYTTYCLENDMKALSTADFGKVMKQVYPRVRPRRLGTRGNSKYCYAGLRKRIKLEAPSLPDLLDIPKSTEFPCTQDDLMEAASRLVREWAESLLGMQFSTLDTLACHLIKIGIVDTRSMAALTIINYFGRNSDKVSKKDTPTGNQVGGKHRETQLQLQRKLHQREVLREQKRKLQLQTPNCDTSNTAVTTSKRTKKVKMESNNTPRTSPQQKPLPLETAHLADIGPSNDLIKSTVSNDYKTNLVSSTSNISSPQTILAQGNNNISGTLRVLPVCDNNTGDSGTKPTTSTQQPAALPDFSSFQSSTNFNSSVQNTPTDNTDIIHDFSKKSRTYTKKLNVNSTITIKSFANKPLSRSNSYENKLETNNSAVTVITAPPVTIAAQAQPVQAVKSNKSNKVEHKLQKTQRLTNQTKKNVAVNPIYSQTKYKSGKIQDIQTMDSSDITPPVITEKAQISDIRSQNNDVTARNETSYALGYYNQIPDSSFNEKLIKIEISEEKFVFPRERVVSIGNIDKDALDDYLYSGSNSQEPEEEIMQYFHNDSSSAEDFTPPTDVIKREFDTSKLEAKSQFEEQSEEKSDKISQLRLLLEKNLKSTKLDTNSIQESTSASTPLNDFNAYNVVYPPADMKSDQQKSLLLSSLLSTSSAKRRVSFDTTPDSVPPSPNTRRKHFSFTPISPGPNSPGTSSGCATVCGGKQSKNSSTNASPFVSPRSTPVPNKYIRTRAQPSTSNRVAKSKFNDVKLSIDISKTQSTNGQFVIPIDQNRKHSLPMSAPPSPMLPHRQKNQTNYLQTLLDTDLPARSSYIPPNDSTANINEYIDQKLQVDNTKMKSDSKSHHLPKLKIDTSVDSIQTNNQTLQNFQLTETDLASNSGLIATGIVHSADPLSQEVSQFFPDEPNNVIFNSNVDNLLFRSQSVPLQNQQIKSLDDNSPNSQSQYYNPQISYTNYINSATGTSNVTSTCSSVGQTPVPSEFNDFTSTILNNENLDKIFSILQQQQQQPEATSNIVQSGIATSSADTNNIIVNDSTDLILTNFNSEINSFLPDNSGNALLRSQSIDFSDDITVKYSNYPPSRSVPSTPLPYNRNELIAHSQLNDYEQSKSHPSTPLINNPTFTYKNLHIGDFLLNGQPIGNKNYQQNYLQNLQKKLECTAETGLLSDTFPSVVDDTFTFPDDTELLDTTSQTFHLATTGDGDLLQLATEADNNTSDNFITSTNNEQPDLQNSAVKK